jgi:hypothetical protein
MKVEKKFDCVEMKAEIQERLLREVAELGNRKPKSDGASGCRAIRSWGSFLRTKMADGKGPERTPIA